MLAPDEYRRFQHTRWTSFALVNTALSLGAAIMQPMFGWVADLAWDGTLIEDVRRYPWAG